jgi:CDP-ribitol ribitolphosphotransferase
MKGLILTVRILAARLGYLLGSFLPVRPRVLLATSHAPALVGNLAFVREELAARTPAIPTVVLARRPAPGFTGRLGALFASVRAGYELARARVTVVDDYFFPIYVIKPRPGTTIVQTWHACGAFKKVGYSTLEKSFGADEELTDRVRIHSNYDVCLVASSASAPFYAEAFRQPLEKFVSRLGIPRTDVFFGDDQVAATSSRIRERYALPNGKTVVLYAPTFRGDTIGRARTPGDLDLHRLRRALGGDHVVLVRQHPFVRQGLKLGGELEGFAIDVSDYPDINELMLVSDVLVTDYSSAIYEFALLGRPMAFFAPDHDAYEVERGFYFDYRTGLPGPIFETTQALATWLRAGVFDLERIGRFRAESFDVADGHATQRLVDEVILPALKRGG